MTTTKLLSVLVTAHLLICSCVDGLSTPPSSKTTTSSSSISSSSSSSNNRRQAIGSLLGGGAAIASSILLPNAAFANTMDTDAFLTSGGVAMPMGVSGQAGKQKPETGVLMREGIDVSRDSKTGNVLAEILVQKSSNPKDKEDYMAVVTSFSSPWPLATGMVYDIECRSSKTGDAAFLAVTPPIDDAGSTTVANIKDKELLKSLFGLRGRFSFYGVPTDIKIKKSTVSSDGQYKILDVNFSTLSQATQTEVPRKSKIVATLPKGSNQIVMLVASSSATRWANNGAEKAITSTVNSFRATPGPPTNLKLRPVTNTRSIFDE